MSNQLIHIVGPTATGKTAYALKLAREFAASGQGVDIISADSRQVYRGMRIGTGVDLPEWLDAQTQIRMFGTEIISPRDEWSVAHFQQYALPIILDAWRAGRVVIVVGGTGLYHKLLFRSDAQLRVGPQADLRVELLTKNVAELQALAQKVAAEKFAQMNESDRVNPRRLVRVIEIAEAAAAEAPSVVLPTLPIFTEKTYGLMDTIEHLAPKIAARVAARMSAGMIEEVQLLMNQFTDTEWKSLPAFSATGYREVRAYLEGLLTKEQALELWTQREVQYAKRQITWWKKEPYAAA